MMRHSTKEPLLSDLLKYVMADEARHVAFGILSLDEFYGELTAQGDPGTPEFCHAAIAHMRQAPSTRRREASVSTRSG
ncbi:MAG: hypothetical protein R2695_17655 [Acidimicrobiales bacterium]